MPLREVPLRLLKEVRKWECPALAPLVAVDFGSNATIALVGHNVLKTLIGNHSFQALDVPVGACFIAAGMRVNGTTGK